ncbi:MAG: GNAT family N-acetyltransferase [Flavobacterium sp.]|nr:GNAT family N-acetyltransferase [Flavobacterium sp.]
MEYHSGRFEDFSLLIFENEILKAVLPANIVENQVFSHKGLTYGGLVLNEKKKLKEVILMFKEVLFFLHKNEIVQLQVKQIPSIYCKVFSDELDYILFLTNAEIYRKDTLSVINLNQKVYYSETRNHGINKGKRNDLIIKEENNFEIFWDKILIPNLKTKHNAAPVHSIDEIEKLALLFKNIRQFNVYHQEEIVAGTTIFETEKVAHVQYISVDKTKSDLGILDFLFDYLISDVFQDKAFFDFGTSNENNGKNLNAGLSFWKESFGARTVVQNFYEVKTENYKLLDNVLI